MNKIIHGVVLALFGAACCFVASILRLPIMAARGHPLPTFTNLCMAVGPYLLLGLGMAATAYCLRVWVRKTDPGHSWVAFLATAVAALGLVMLPTIVAIYLPLVGALNRLAHN
jgi:hypothetical protein